MNPKHQGHDEIEGHEDANFKRYRLRAASPLSSEEEDVMTRTIGCGIAVHNDLGPGYFESIFRKAMCIELEARNMAYEVERPVRVTYRGVEIPGQRIDLIVEGLIIVELKAVDRLLPVHTAQVVSYLKTTGLRGGLLMNFNVQWLKQGLRRVVV